MPHLGDGSGEGAWVLDMVGDPDPYVVTLGFTATDLAFAEGFVSDMADAWDARLKASMTSDISLRETRAQFNDFGTMRDILNVVGTLGTGGTGVLPQNCALLVRKNTGIAGRAHRGRMYWPGILAEGDVNAVGVVDAGPLASLQTHFSGVLSDLIAAGSGVPSVMHTNVLLAPDTIISLTVERVIATQRRRLR